MRLFGRRPLRSLDLQRKKRRRRRFIAIAAFFISAAAIVGGSWASALPDVTIQTVRVSGSASSADTEAIRLIAEEEIGGAYGHLFARANFLVYPKRDIRERILDSLARVLDARVALESPTALAIAVSYRAPAYRWCGITPTAETVSSDCYVADDAGVIFGIAPLDRGGLLTIESPQSEQRARAGSVERAPFGFYALPPETLGFLASFKEALAARGIAVSSARFATDGASELALQNGVRILFDMRQSVPVVMNTLDSALETEAVRAADLIGAPSRLEYLDVRFGERVYYKYAR